MALTKVETDREVIFKAAPGFNHKAAQRFYDAVMKMDDDEAFTFMEFTLANVLEEDIAKNLRAYQSHLDKVIKKRIEDVKRATIRSVSKSHDPQQTLAFSQALTLIEKDLSGGALADFNEVHPRGSGGRFKTKVSNSGGYMKPQTARQLGFDQGNKKFSDEKGDERHLSAKERQRYAEDYQQLANFLQTVQSSGNPGDYDTYVTFKDLKSGHKFTDRVSSTNPNKVKWNPTHETIDEIETRPSTLTAGGAYFGLTSALGSTAGPGGQGRMERLNNFDQQGANEFANSWLKAGMDQQQNSNATRYDRIHAGSKLLGDLSAPGSKTQMAARMAQFVGDHGAEAEAVFGPQTRKSAYRYRGTSKEPDKQLVRSYDAAVQRAKMANATDPYRRTPEGRAANLKRPSDLSPVQMAAARVQAERRNPTAEEVDSALPQVISHMRGKLPKPGLYNLQLASGNTPPSQGVLIDKNGKIVDEAVGYGDDHYLPFNLKKMKHLNGGQYVRTRSVGGPTSEDIYTGLMSGASQLTVVSRSGTFTVTFADDFKGKRRYNDKALRMSRRYEQILDAVQSEQVDREGVMDEMKNVITQEVLGEYANTGTSAADMRVEINRRLDEYKADPELSGRDHQRIQQIAALRAAAASGDTSRDARAFVRQVEADVAAEKEHKFRLNGPGYDAALQALAEQFPYYLTVHSDVEANPERKSTKDRGYVEPGRNRPTAAQAGLYGTKVNQGRKFSASQADYQGTRAVQRGGTRNGTLTPVEAAGEEKVAEGAAKPGEKPKSVVEQVREERKAADAALALRNAVAVRPEDRESFHNMSDEEFRSWVKNPTNFGTFDAWAQRAEQVATQTPEGQRAYGQVFRDYKVGAGKVGGKKFDKTLAGQVTKPMEFDGDAYKPGATPEQRAMEMRKIGGERHGVATDRPLQDMTPQELDSEVRRVGEILEVQQRYGNLDMDARKELVQGTVNNTTRNHVMESADNALGYLETVQRMRTLRANAADETRPNVTTNQPSGPPPADTGDRIENLYVEARDMELDLADGPDKEVARQMAQAAGDAVEPGADFENFYNRHGDLITRWLDVKHRHGQR
jgi:hypothetical protein